MTRLVLVPGAWHLPTHYSTLLAALGRHGYIVGSIANKTLNSTTATVSDDAAAQRKLILALIDAGHDVVVIAHSYGNYPAGKAAAGLSKAARSQSGQVGGVIDLLYITSFVIPEDTTLNSATGVKPHDFVKVMDNTSFPDATDEIFYGLCSAQDIHIAKSLIRPQSAKFLASSSSTTPA